MWTRDNLDVLRGLNSESIDLVYADPPFNSNRHRWLSKFTKENPVTRTIATAAVAIALVSIPAFAERQTVSPEQQEEVKADLLAATNRFGLFTGCEPISLAISEPERLVTTEQVEAAVESRLRAARLFRGSMGLGDLLRMILDGRGGVLFVQITVVDQAFSIVLWFAKPLLSTAVEK